MLELLLSQILNGVVIGFVYALIALGFSLVFGVANIINFAQGALLMLGAFLTFTMIRRGIPIAASVALSIALTTAVGMLIAGALVFNYVVTREDLPNALNAMLAGYHLSPFAFLLVVNILLLILGCLLDASMILLVIVPILIPAAKALGIDMVHFGLVVVVNLMIGLITPPYGLLLFIVSNFTRQPLRVIVREAVPFIAVLIVALFVITYVPDTTLWLPRIFGYKG